jgi:hypothetical protein
MTPLAAAVVRAASWLDTLEEATWLPTLLIRLFVGYLFFVTGVAKVQNLGAMAERFTEWGIPFPAFSAALSGYTELIGGALVVVGLLTRLASSWPSRSTPSSSSGSSSRDRAGSAWTAGSGARCCRRARSPAGVTLTRARPPAELGDG